ncbi:amidohydrolase family protein [Hyphomonas sp.]|uniref:amidohydrolase family protein n=1 Tax=Hyphomonas sp. TaxID=87 RepID=UPI0025BE1A0A|nr:amidohydrolase family protein [Hyphomonas sp.]
MPGLIDAHVHSPPRLAFGNQELYALLYVSYGVTSVRDVGATEKSVRALVARSNAERLVGPHMYWCGQVLESPPLSFGAARSVVTKEEGRAAVLELFREGVDCIKIYNNLAAEAYLGIREAAAEVGLPVIGHVPHLVGIANTQDFEAQHMTGLPYFAKGEAPKNSDFRDADWLSMTAQDIDTALIAARERRFSFLPTLANGRLRLIASDPERFPPTPGSSHMPEIWFEAWDSQTTIAAHPTGDGIALREARLPLLSYVTGRARELGIDVLAGTDSLMPYVVPGESLHLEISELAKAFGDNEAALAAATTTNGRHIDSGVIGVIAPGARADILLLPSDPVADLSALKDWTILFVNGRRHDRAAIDEAVQRYDRHFHSSFYTATMRWASRFASSGKGRQIE